MFANMHRSTKGTHKPKHTQIARQNFFKSWYKINNIIVLGEANVNAKNNRNHSSNGSSAMNSAGSQSSPRLLAGEEGVCFYFAELPRTPLLAPLGPLHKSCVHPR